MTSQDTVRDYFNREAQRFDAIYSTDKSIIQRIVDSVRGVVVERLRLLCTLIPATTPWSVLDVGGGSGRYGIAFAGLGARRIVSIDVAKAMNDLAEAEAAKAGVADRCEFVTSPFLDYRSSERFDAVVAMGYFDYLDDPDAHLRRMIELCSGRVYISLPKRWEIRVPTRKLRFAIERGFVRFYSHGEMRRLLASAGVPPDRWSVINFGRDWIVVIRVAP